MGAVAATSVAMDGVAPELSPGWAIEERTAIVLLAQRTQRKQHILLPYRTLPINALSAERSRSQRCSACARVDESRVR